MLVRVTLGSESEALRLATDETYDLEVSAPNATISAPTVYGAMHALETLGQIIDPRSATSPNASISWAVSISDGPRFPHRGLMVDSSRNFLSPRALRRTIDGMAMNKLNVLHWHLSDAQSFPFVSRRYPELSEHGAYRPQMVYDPTTVASLRRYAAARGVRLVPEFDAPGHVWQGWHGWASRYGQDELTVCGGHEPWEEACAEPPCGQLDPTNNFTYAVLEGLWGDVAEAFGDEEFFHVGGDEISYRCWNTSGRVRGWMAAHGLQPSDPRSFTELWALFQARADGIVRAAGAGPRTLVKWDDTFAAGLPIANDTVIQVWHGLGMLSRAVKAGHRAILSNSDAWYLDCGTGNWVSGGTSWCEPYKSWQSVWENEPLGDAALSDEEAARVLGGEGALWSEAIDDANIDQKAWPRGAALAERLWSPRDVLAGYTAQTRAGALLVHRDRMVARGLGAEAMQPRFCLEHPGACGGSAVVTGNAPMPLGPTPVPVPRARGWRWRQGVGEAVHAVLV